MTSLVCLPLMALADGLGIPYGVYTVLNFLIGLAAGFPMNLKWVFPVQKDRRLRALVRYWTAFPLLIALVQALQFLVIDGAGWPRFWGVGTGLVLYASAGYLLARLWVFREKPPAPSLTSSFK